jgi:hypothetical protein
MHSFLLLFYDIYEGKSESKFPYFIPVKKS